MARTSRPDSIYHVSIHRNGGHLYAATHPYTLDGSGKRKYSVVHWGTLTETLRFIPGKRYLEAPEAVRRQLVFPQGWDLSAIAAESEAPAHALPFREGDGGKAFGSVWLLEQVVGRTGLREDLCEALGSKARADDLLTLAYFPFLTGMSFLRFSRWQASTKLPSVRPLGQMLEESLAAVGRADCRRFMDLRRARHEGERLCAVDSVSRHSIGSALSDRKWGQKTERIHYQSSIEAVAYSLDSHVPVVYSTYPEAVTDSRGIGIFRSELAKVGLGAVTVVTDRGYDSLKGLEQYYRLGPMVMCVDVKQPAVMQRIEAFGRFRSHPAGMRYDAASRRWYSQFRLDGPGDLRLNLFFNPDRREAELAQIDAEILSQQNALKEILEYGVTLSDRKTLRRDFYFFSSTYDSDKQTITSFKPNRSRILSTRAASGFYANITYGLDAGPLEAVGIYGLKYDQEKFLRQFRSLLEFPHGSTHLENLEYGVHLIQYIALLLNTWLRHALQAAQAQLPFRSLLEMLDEFHTAPCAGSGEGTCIPSPLTPVQQQAISALGFRCPQP